MKKSFLLMLIAIVVLSFVGCAMLKQGVTDYQTGKDTALTEGETSPKDQAEQIIGLVQAIPVVGNYAGFLLPVLVGFFTWKRGKKIRVANNGTTATPAIGILSSVGVGKVNLESVFQIVTDVVQGAFEVGSDGSAVKRGWKMGLSVLLAIVSTALVSPTVKDLILQHPQVLATITGLSALFGGLEKKLSTVSPSVPV